MVSKIEATNFMSWESLRFDVDKGITLIDGWNEDDQTSEGSGKSAILNALSWCIYGKIPKEANIDEVISHGAKSCSVVVKLSNGVEIVRTRKPNDLFMHRLNSDDKIKFVSKKKDARETQKMIEEYIGLSFDAFCQSVYFAQNNEKSFLKANQEARGKILSEVQDLELFDRARKETMVMLKLEEKQLTELRHGIQIERKNLEMVDQQIVHEERMKSQLQSQKDSQLASMAQDIDHQKSTLDFYETELQKIVIKFDNIQRIDKEPLQADMDALKEQVIGIRTQLGNAGSRAMEYDRLEAQGKRSADAYSKAQKKIEDLETFIKNPTKNCPTCGSLLENCDTTHAQSEVDTLKGEMNLHMQNMEAVSKDMSQIELRDVTELQKEANHLDSLVKQRASEIKRLEQEEKNAILYQTQIDNSQKEIEKTKQMIAAMEAEYVEFEKKPVVFDDTNLQRCHEVKKEITFKINTQTELLNNKIAHVNRLETLKKGFKDIKSYVFNSMLNELNSRISIYLDKLFEIPVTLSYVTDNMKIGTKLTINGHNQGLGMFSGGQTRRLSLATDLALSDVVSSRKGNELGILVLDEYFKDLSEQSMEKCLSLLESRNQPVLLIEHNSIFKNIVDNTFFTRYENGKSYVQV